MLTGGPVDSSRGFVLHSRDYHATDATMTIDDTVAMTATLDVLRAIAHGEGPKEAVLALGYSSWSPWPTGTGNPRQQLDDLPRRRALAVRPRL